MPERASTQGQHFKKLRARRSGVARDIQDFVRVIAAKRFVAYVGLHGPAYNFPRVFLRRCREGGRERERQTQKRGLKGDPFHFAAFSFAQIEAAQLLNPARRWRRDSVKCPVSSYSIRLAAHLFHLFYGLTTGLTRKII